MLTPTPTTGLISPTPVAWSPSANHLAIPFGRLLHLYSLLSSPPSPTRVALSSAHHAPISFVAALPSMHFLTTSLDGTLRFWDLLDLHCLRTIDLASPILHAALTPSGLLCLTASSLLLHSLYPHPPTRSTIIPSLSPRPSSRLAFAPASSLIAVTASRTLHLTTLHRKSRPHVSIVFPKPLVSVAFSSDAALLAVADASGKIHILKNPATVLSKPSLKPTIPSASLFPTILHWHASPVRALTFAHNDSVLLSAGNEAVVVVWTMSSISFGDKSFLPRLHGPIIAISVSPDHTHYAISHADNTVSLLHQSSSSVSTVIRTLAVPHQTPKRLQLALCPAPVPGRVFVANGSSLIQEFDPLRGVHISEFAAVPANDVFQPTHNRQGVSSAPRVINVISHSSGNYLATVDVVFRSATVRGRARGETVYTLRFWRRDIPSGNWRLSAMAQAPHGEGCSVTAIDFHPILPVVVTTGSDKRMRMWRAVQKPTRNGEPAISWRSELDRGFRGRQCDCVTFSPDGSLLAMGCGNLIAMWEIHSAAHVEEDTLVDFAAPCSFHLSLLHPLVRPAMSDSVKRVKFVTGDLPLVIGLTSNGVYAWNVITQAIWWSFGSRCDPERLTVDEESGRFAIVVKVARFVAGEDESAKMEDVNVVEETVERINSDNEGDVEMDDNDAIDRGDNRHLDKTREENPKKGKEKKKKKKKKNDVKTSEKNPTRRKERRKHGGPALREKPHKDGKSPKEFDYAVAVFNGKGPVPLCVTRLRPGVKVVSLAFVKPAKGATKNSLICIGDDMEVNVVRSDSDMDEFSLVSDEDANVTSGITGEAEGVRKLDELLGSGWREDVASDVLKGNEVEVERGDGPAKQLLDKHFTGPIHAQAPASTQSFQFLMGLLELETKAASSGAAETDEESARDSTGTAAINEYEDRPAEAGDSLSFADMGRFCEKLVSERSSHRNK